MTAETEEPARSLAPGLYVVATPIGNLEDITLRALRVLRGVDRIACEDTRQTQKLLNHFGIRTPTVSYHMHNERSRAAELVQALAAGGSLALVSDAGTPALADPGEDLVRAALEHGVAVMPVPGANAALAALVASGLGTERFLFHGFLPSRPGERRSALEQVRAHMLAAPATQIFYESPHRIAATLADVVAVFGGAHPVALSRELTKLHEETLRGAADEVLRNVTAREQVRGEFVLLLAGKVEAAAAAGLPSFAAAVEERMRSAGLEERDALKQVARERGLGRSEAYREWQRTRGR